MEILSHDRMKSLKILLVDDDTFALRVIRHVLYGLGVENIEEAFNGEDAIEKLGTQNFDLLITDVEMPKLNGLELLKSIRCDLTKSPRILPTIIITSLANSDVIGVALSLDVNGFLAKPIRPVDVSAKISKAMSETSSAKPISAYKPVEANLKALREKIEIPEKSVKQSSPPGQAGETEGKPSKSAAPQTEGDRVLIRELKPGMRLGQDLFLKDTYRIFKAGDTLSETSINRLIELAPILKEDSILVLPREK